jgi:hypothetical protein
MIEVQKSLIRVSQWHLALVLGLLVVAGCNSNAAPAVADQDEARQTLEQALTAWQKGETVQAMKNASPSITVSDPVWARGDALKKFEIEGPGKLSGAERAFSVTLWVADGKGKEKPQQVVFKVGTQPIYTVFRSMF